MWKLNPSVYIAGILIYSRSKCSLCMGMMRRLCRKKRALVSSSVLSASHQVCDKKKRDLVSSSLPSASHQVCGMRPRDLVSSSLPSVSHQVCDKKRSSSSPPSVSHQVCDKKRSSSSPPSVSHQVCGKEQRDSVSSSVPSASPQAFPVHLASPLWSPAMNVPRALGNAWRRGGKGQK